MKISIVGAAGVIGRAISFCIGEKRLADSIALIDLPGDALDFQAFDLSTAVSGLGIKVDSGGRELLKGSSLVVMAAAAPVKNASSRQEMLAANLSLTSEIANSIRHYCPDTILLNVTNPIEALAFAIYHLAGIKPERTIGYSLNDTFRFRILLADSLKTDSSCVEAFVIGEHGDTQVPVFSQVKVNGQLVEISPQAEQQILSKIPDIYVKLKYFHKKTGLTAAWTSAIGISDIIKAIVTDAKQVFAGATILQGEYGLSGICLGVPVMIGARGIEKIIELPLSQSEKKAFNHSAEKIRLITAKTLEILEESRAS